MPGWLNETWLRLKALLRRKQLDRDLADELQFHLAMREEMVPGTSAHRGFGNLTLLKESCRELWTFAWIETLMQDLRYGVRMLRRSPTFTAAAVLSLALGIGANTAIFSLLDAIVLKMLPVREPQQLVEFSHAHAVYGEIGFTYPMFQHFRDNNRVLQHLTTFRDQDGLNVIVDGQGQLSTGQFVSGEYYSMLGVDARIGRLLFEIDDKAASPPVAVISYACWQRRFGRDAQIAGKHISINGVPFTIVGVAAPEFLGVSVGYAPDFQMPLSTFEAVTATPGRLRETGGYWLQVMGRLKPGVTRAQASAEFGLLYQNYMRPLLASDTSSQGEFMRGVMAQVRLDVLPASTGGQSALRQQFASSLRILMVIVGLVLLVACANIANLQLSRSAARQREMAVRLAIGAQRRRLVQQLLTESALLSLLGGMLGVLFAQLGAGLLVRMITTSWLPSTLHLSLNLRVLTFAAFASLLATVLFGLAPAVSATSTPLSVALNRKIEWAGGGRLPWGKLLVVSQITLSLILLAGAGLFATSLRKLTAIDAGFDRDQILLFSMNPRLAGYPESKTRALYQELIARLRRLPAVVSVSVSSARPLGAGRYGFHQLISVRGYQPKRDEQMVAGVSRVSDDYFRAMGTPLIRGRFFNSRDDERAPKVAIINEAVARAWFAGKDPIGRRLGFGMADRDGDLEVVGVVRNAKYDKLREDAPLIIYTPSLQEGLNTMTVLVRTAASPASLFDLVRGEVASLDRALPMERLSTMAVEVDEALVRERLLAMVSGFFGLLALALACLGLYGVMAYAVTRRTNEIGIRMALGAQSGQVIWLVLREVVALVGLGIAAGVPLALSLRPLIASLLYGVPPADVTAIAGASILMTFVALLAGYLPAHRASRVDPIAALRWE